MNPLTPLFSLCLFAQSAYASLGSETPIDEEADEIAQPATASHSHLSIPKWSRTFNLSYAMGDPKRRTSLQSLFFTVSRNEHFMRLEIGTFFKVFRTEDAPIRLKDFLPGLDIGDQTLDFTMTELDFRITLAEIFNREYTKLHPF